jgi:hypothetical protein
MLSDDSTLFVKERFGFTVNLDRCLVQKRCLLANALTLTNEDESRNQRVACQEAGFKDGRPTHLI